MISSIVYIFFYSFLWTACSEKTFYIQNRRIFLQYFMYCIFSPESINCRHQSSFYKSSYSTIICYQYHRCEGTNDGSQDVLQVNIVRVVISSSASSKLIKRTKAVLLCTRGISQCLRTLLSKAEAYYKPNVKLQWNTAPSQETARTL